MWCDQQRQKFLKKDAAGTPLSDEQIQRLNDAGFVWKPRVTWDDYFKMLLEFKAQEGHCRVPQLSTEHKELAQWVHRMRRMYRDIILKGQKTKTLTKERIKMMEDAGFVWNVHKDKREASGLGGLKDDVGNTIESSEAGAHSYCL